jgi:ABC-type dipeptide/oligopeptide/nickel transport system permease component
MKSWKLVLAGLPLVLACMLPTLASFMAAFYERVARVITLILSTEILTPAFIFGLVLVVYFTSKSRTWRYLQ